MDSNRGFVARQISKRFGATQALDDVTCEVLTGEIHAVLGENGAGKSTLVKIMSGHLQPDEGRLELDGEVMPALTPKAAFEAGIVVVHQELSLLPTLSVAENILINDPPLRAGLLDRRAMVEKSKAHLALLAADIDPLVTIERLSQAQRQLVEIARALVHSARVILLDEPTSSLPPDERHELFGRLRLIREQGVGIVFITHLLEEALELSDRITVLRDGRNVGSRGAAETSVTRLVELMTGRATGTVFPSRRSTSAEVPPLLTVSSIASGPRLLDASFDVREGEIVGLAGLVGSGRTEVLKAVFGAMPVDSGRVMLGGEPVQFRTTLDAIRRGISFIPEDRQDESVFPDHTVLTNICVAAASSSVGEPLQGRFILDGRLMASVSEKLRAKLQIKTRSVTAPIADLSGGNQQKTILARWVATRPRIVLADEPTRGVSIGSKIEIYRLFRELASEGAAIVLVSSEFEELVGLCERVFIMAAGRTVDEVDPAGLEADDLLQLVLSKSTTGTGRDAERIAENAS